MLKSLTQKSNQEEASSQRFLEAAKESRSHYNSTKQHVTHKEFSEWVDQLQTNPYAIPPASHT
jgi:hypothetical protein